MKLQQFVAKPWDFAVHCATLSNPEECVRFPSCQCTMLRQASLRCLVQRQTLQKDPEFSEWCRVGACVVFSP